MARLADTIVGNSNVRDQTMQVGNITTLHGMQLVISETVKLTLELSTQNE